jgi:glycosyltransferase involved in cell wall biosynthesis
MDNEDLDRNDAGTNTVWILTEVYFPEEISTGYYLTSIAEGLAEKRRVKVLTGQPKHMSRGTRAPTLESRNGVEIHRAWGTTFDKNVFGLRLINMATIGLSMFVRSLRSFQAGDQVLVVTAPPTLPVTTAIACLIRGATLTILIQDSYPENLVAVGSASPNSLFVTCVDLVNRWVYKYASKIIVMGRDMKELFERKTRGLDVPVVVIPNWSDTGTISPEPRAANSLLRKLGITEKFVLLYAGNMGHPTDVESIIGAARMLVDRPEFHFLFIGAGVKKNWVEEQSASLPNTTVLHYRPWSEQSNFLNACDIGLVALIKGMWGTAMPSRTYNIMAAGKPLIALTDEGSELARVIDEERIGWHITPGSSETLKETILKVYEMRSELEEMGMRARKAALSKYSPRKAIEAYSDAMRG